MRFSVGCRVMVICLRVDDRLNGVDNFGPWKERESLVQPLTDPTQLVDFNKRNVKARRIILDAIKDHIFLVGRNEVCLRNVGFPNHTTSKLQRE